MKASTKAVLISALIFPGLGHLALRRGARGLLFIVPAAIAMIYLLRSVLQLMSQLLDEINSGKLGLDPFAILERVHASGIDNAATNLASAVVFICWIGAAVDVLWLSRKLS